MRFSIKAELIAPPRLEPLGQGAFEPFGQVLERPGPEGKQTYSDSLASLAPESKPALNFVRVSPPALPLKLTFLERHPLSTQSFLPLEAKRYLVCVTPSLADGMPDLSKLKAFAAEGRQGVTYRAGVWHTPITALDRDATFAVLMWVCGRDTEFADFDRPVELSLDL